MRKALCLALLMAWAATSPTHAETPTLDAIKTATDEAWKGVKSLSGEITMEFVMPFAEKPLNLTGKGDLHMLREDGKDKFRKRVSARLPEPFAMEMKLDVLYDGRKVRTITELMGQTQSQEGDPSLRQGALPPGGADLLSAMEKEMALTPLPNSEVGGQACFVVEGRAKDPEIPFSKVVFYLDQALGIQRKVEIYQQDGTVGISETIENIKLDAAPDPSLFAVQK
jgi:outer membrane lipoprotein-sorting protein